MSGPKKRFTAYDTPQGGPETFEYLMVIFFCNLCVCVCVSVVIVHLRVCVCSLSSPLQVVVRSYVD